MVLPEDCGTPVLILPQSLRSGAMTLPPLGSLLMSLGMSARLSVRREFTRSFLLLR